MNVEGKRIFVFNRRILSDESKEPQRIRLLPHEVSKPDIYNGKYSGCNQSLLVYDTPFSIVLVTVRRHGSALDCICELSDLTNCLSLLKYLL